VGGVNKAKKEITSKYQKSKKQIGGAFEICFLGFI
jgi:hypothetical protein